MTKTLAMRPEILTGAAVVIDAEAETSSPRCRSDSPPIVFDGEILHWLRILLVFTRPYLGTASSMSKTLAVST